MPNADHTDVTRLLNAAGAGDADAAEELLPLIYEELRALAQARMAGEGAHTLQPTALVHEAYLRLIGPAETAWSHRGHFFLAAAQAMRRILIERARRRGRIKRGGDRQRVTLDENAIGSEDRAEQLLELDEALKKLEVHDARRSQIVMLRYFAGLTIEETAAAMGLSTALIKREWAIARAWLYRELNPGALET
jgi:RNA polymerase sigma factor (TIGR02999 family)